MACSWAIAPVCAQDISQIAKSDPLIITGSIGTNNTYFHSSAGLGYMSPLSNSFFANLNFNIYGFSMPFSIYFSNDNLNFSYPQFSFNLSPSYKNFTAHIGQSSMPFSQYVLNMSFNGVGLEWRDKQFRASAFYGVLRRAVNDNPDDPTAAFHSTDATVGESRQATVRAAIVSTSTSSVPTTRRAPSMSGGVPVCGRRRTSSSD